MGNSQRVMPKVDFEKDEKLKTAYIYSKYLEGKNFERSVIAKKFLKRKRITLAVSLIAVFSIYSYTIVKIKQELFLDDFEEPPRVKKIEA